MTGSEKTYADKGTVLCPRCLNRYPASECDLFGITYTPGVISKYEIVRAVDERLSEVHVSSFLPPHWKIGETVRDGLTASVEREDGQPTLVKVVHEASGAAFEYAKRECPHCFKRPYAETIDISLPKSCGKGPQLVVGVYGPTRSGKTCYYRAMRETHFRAGLSFFFNDQMTEYKEKIDSTGNAEAEFGRYIYEISSRSRKRSRFQAMVTYRDCSGEDLDASEPREDQKEWMRKSDVVLLVVEPLQLEGVRETLKDPAIRERVVASGVIEDAEIQAKLDGGPTRFEYLTALHTGYYGIDYTRTRLQLLLTKSNQLREIVKAGGLKYAKNGAPLLGENCPLFLNDESETQYFPRQTLGVSRLVWELIKETDQKLFGILKKLAEDAEIKNGWPSPRMAAFCVNAFENNGSGADASQKNWDYRRSCRVAEPLLWTLCDATGYGRSGDGDD